MVLKTGFRFLALFLFTTSIVFAAEVKKEEEKTFKFEKGGNIILVANEGMVEVKSWDKDEVHLKMIKRVRCRNRKEAERILDDLEIRIQESRNKLVIRERSRRYHDGFNVLDIFDGDFWTESNGRSIIIDFELTVPKNVDLKFICDEGDVNIQDIHGSLNIDVDEGDITLEDIQSSKIQLSIDEGDVELENISDEGNGFCHVETDEGDIYMHDVTVQEMDLRTDEGDIVLRDVETHRLWAVTDEGNIQTDLITRADGSYQMETDEGDLEVTIPSDANLMVKLYTDEGTIDSDFDLSRRHRDDSERLEGRIGNGKGLLKGYTDEGDVILVEKR